MTILLALPKLALILASEMFSVEMSMTAGQVIWFFLIVFALGFFLGMLYTQFTYKPKEKK